MSAAAAEATRAGKVTRWVVAALGIACGAGQWATSVIAVVITLALLILGERVERKLRQRRNLTVTHTSSTQPPTTLV